MEKGVFVCPFCCAPYDAILASGIVETKCKKCGNRFPIPSGLSGVQGQCVNHPESEIIGLCSRCGQGFCEQCLYVNDRGADTLYRCSSCTMDYVKRYFRSSTLLIVIGMVMFLVAISQMHPVDIMENSVIGELARYGITTSCAGVLVKAIRPRMRTLEQKRLDDHKHGNLTWAECPYCKAGYFYAFHQVRPD